MAWLTAKLKVPIFHSLSLPAFPPSLALTPSSPFLNLNTIPPPPQPHFSASYFFSARLLGMSSSCYGANVTVSLTSPLPVSQQIHRFIDCPDDP